MLKVKCYLVAFYLKMCENSQGKPFSLWCANNMPFLFYNISSVFGDGSFSKSFLISWQDWFSSTIKSAKKLQSDVVAWWATWVWNPHQSSFSFGFWAFPHFKQHHTLSNPEGARPYLLLVSQPGMGYVGYCFNFLISLTTKQFVIPQHQEPRHSDFNFSFVPIKLHSRSTIFLSQLPDPMQKWLPSPSWIPNRDRGISIILCLNTTWIYEA